MTFRYRLPSREQVFIESLMYHGFRKVRSLNYLKFRMGFVLPATTSEDAEGIDFLVKMPRDDIIYPVQITQRGVTLVQKYHVLSKWQLDEWHARAHERIEKKRRMCKRSGIAFVLVRDFAGTRTNPCIAWGDIKALRYGIARV